MPLRTFLALDIGPAVREKLGATMWALQQQCDVAARWVRPENLHITLNFLGDVADRRLVDVCDMVADAAQEVESFDFSVRGVRCVPEGARSRMVWADVRDPNGAMAQLHRAMTEAMQELDFAPDRRGFNGHITLARIKQPRDAGPLRDAVADLSEVHFGAARASEVAVYTSVRSADGPAYAAAARCPLA